MRRIGLVVAVMGLVGVAVVGLTGLGGWEVRAEVQVASAAQAAGTGGSVQVDGPEIDISWVRRYGYYDPRAGRVGMVPGVWERRLGGGQGEGC
jgi:hypothetical protein